MSEHNYTVEEVRDLLNQRIVDTYAGSSEGQAHLNRIAKSITNESLEKRLQSQRATLAEAAFNKELAKIAARSPEMVPLFLTGKAAWLATYISRRYGASEA